MAAQFVTSDSEHDSEGASPIHQSVQSSPHRHSKSTPGNIFNNKMDSNPFDDDFGDEDPFDDNNPNNPFNDPFGINNKNKNNNNNISQNKRTDATQQEIQEKRSKTPEPEMPPIFNPHQNPNQLNNNNSNNNMKGGRGVNRRHSQPVNSMNNMNNINLDDIFSDFQPKEAKQTKQIKQIKPLKPIKPTQSTAINDKRRSKSVFMARGPPQINKINKMNKINKTNNNNNKRRGSVNKKVLNDDDADNDELSVAKKTGYDISYFIDKDIAYKYLCIICENVCRNTVELTCKKKRHLCCEYCIKKYFDIHGNKCPIHPEHSNLQYSSSRFTKYHIESLKVKCPYSTSSGIHGGCSWIDQLKNLDKHLIEHTKFVRCPFSDYGCKSLLKIDDNNDNDDDNDNNKSEQTLEEHLISSQHQHLVLLLKQSKILNDKLNNKNRIIDELKINNNSSILKINYLYNTSQIGSDNIWVLCGSHKFWKHKYNQLYTVNLRNECRTQIRIYDISRVANNNNIITSTPSSLPNNNNANNNSNGTSTTTSTTTTTTSSQIYDPTQSDSWDVGDLGVAHINNSFSIPIWLMKKYPNLDVFNRDRFNSIIFRCGGHLIRDKKVTSRCDAILLDNHYNAAIGGDGHGAIPMQELIGYKLNCFPNLPTKRYNCECVYSQRHGLIVVGGSGVDKNQINYVNQLKIRDQDVNITYNKNINNDEKDNNNNNKDNDDYHNKQRLIAQKTSYPFSTTFNITLEWKSLSPILRAREDTAMCLFSDKNINWKEFIIICGGWSNGCLRTSELYNFEANKWIQLPPMHIKHNAAGITQWKHNNSIIICGGFNTEAHYATEYFNLIKQKWIKLPNTNYKHRYKPAVWIKNSHNNNNYNPQIICCAGSGVLKNEVGTVEYLDSRDNKWSTVKKPLSNLLGLGANINANNWRMWRIFT